MKAIWLVLCAAVAALSFYPEYIVLNGNVYYFHAFWLSTAIVTRIVQVLFILSVLGWLRDLSKHKGHVIGRLMSRTFIMIGAVMALYIPWDEMTDADPLWVRIVWTVSGAAIWFVALVLLIGNTEQATQATNQAIQDAKNEVNSAVTEAKSEINSAVADVRNEVNNAVKQAKGSPKEHCTRCGFINIPNASFCGECGSAL
jgi:hypothetical protein